jgi:hypothetical protein
VEASYLLQLQYDSDDSTSSSIALLLRASEYVRTYVQQQQRSQYYYYYYYLIRPRGAEYFGTHNVKTFAANSQCYDTNESSSSATFELPVVDATE